MRQKATTGSSRRFVFAGPEEHIPSQSESTGADPAGCNGGRSVRVYPNIAKIIAETAFEKTAVLVRQGRAAAPHIPDATAQAAGHGSRLPITLGLNRFILFFLFLGLALYVFLFFLFSTFRLALDES